MVFILDSNGRVFFRLRVVRVRAWQLSKKNFIFEALKIFPKNMWPPRSRGRGA